MIFAGQSSQAVFAKRPIAILGALVGWTGTSLQFDERREDGQPLAVGYILNAAFGLLVTAAAANASRGGWPWADILFTAGIVWLYVPLAAKAFSRNSTPSERFSAVIIATAALFVVKLIREPIAFIEHDEFLHWTTANHILDSGRLFSPNALLPVSPLYPGLEAATTALVTLSGLTVFQAANVILGVCRLGLMAALFIAYRRLSDSTRIAASGCFIYMGSSSFLVFDAQFAYESLAVFLVAACILSDIVSREGDRCKTVLSVTIPLILSVTITHHITSYILSAYFFGVAALASLKAGPRPFLKSSVAVALVAGAAPLLWSRAMGDPESGYLGPVLSNGAHEFVQVLTFSVKRTLFQAPDGYVTPLWQRVVTLASVLLICCGLAIGFLRTLRLAGVPIGPAVVRNLRLLRTWRSEALIVFTLITLAYPTSMLFRLTKSGWEIGNRIGPFSFTGAGIVVAVGVVSLLRGREFVASAVFAGVASVVLVGGYISSQGPRILVPGNFHVAADSASMSWLGIDAAEWTRRWLGERNLFASDRINRLLLSTYGRQDVSSSLQDGINLSSVILGPTLDPQRLDLLRKVGIDYLAIDLRMSTELPSVGAYIDGDEGDQNHRTPPLASSLLKFDGVSDVSRVFDDGYILIYDTRGLHAFP